VQNPHPLIVHFPIAFLLGFAGATLLALVVRRPGLEQFARSCLFVGTAAAVCAVVTGFLAEQSVAPVAAARHDIERHRTLGYVLLGLASVLTALAAVAPRHPSREGLLRALQSGGAVAVLAVLYLTAEEGGELVHEYGVGTEMTAPGGPLAETGDPGDPDMPHGNRLPPVDHSDNTTAPTDSAPKPTRSDFR